MSPPASRFRSLVFQEVFVVSLTACCRRCCGAESSVTNTKERRCATISNCQGPRTDFFDQGLCRCSSERKYAHRQIQSSASYSDCTWEVCTINASEFNFR